MVGRSLRPVAKSAAFSASRRDARVVTFPLNRPCKAGLPSSAAPRLSSYDLTLFNIPSLCVPGHSCRVSFFDCFLPPVVQRMPSVSQMDFGNMIGLKVRDIKIVKLRTTKGAVRWPFGLFAFRIVQQH